jgi:hypothetical protein
MQGINTTGIYADNDYSFYNFTLIYSDTSFKMNSTLLVTF